MSGQRAAWEITAARDRAAALAYVDTERRRAAAERRRRYPRGEDASTDDRHRARLLMTRLFASLPDWYEQAACKGQTDAMFEIPANLEPALALCATCPVQEPCRAQGRKDREFGVWGGETEVDRSRAGRGNSRMTGTASKVQAEARRNGTG